MRPPEPLTSLPLVLPLAARVLTLGIAAVICFVLAGCAGPAVAQREDREQCHRASEPEIAALFDRWNA